MHSITETAMTVKSRKIEKKFKCPYCELRIERSKLSSHIDKKHEELLPEGYSAGRVAFNTINKKEVGHCIICQSETEWNETKQRYERLCNSKSCHDKYVKLVDERLKKAKGVTKQEMLSNPEFQNKMLNGRSISGTYKMSDGGSKSYVGSYELDFLKFIDAFLEIKSDDIISPGPTIEYYYEGKKHFWILDYWYLPYNLVIDIKDGGANPNTRNMPEYRAKQAAKEKAIAQLGQYNYIRLTDKNYAQLIEMMIRLKESYIDFEDTGTPSKPIIKINEQNFIIGDKISILEKKNETPLYFYHMINNDIDLKSTGLISLDYMYKHGLKDLFEISSEKYRNRLCNGWGIYPGRDPDSLTLKEVYDGINSHRGKDGTNSIYFFKYPPYKNLHDTFENLYNIKKIYRININDSKVKQYIDYIDWGYENSHTDNKKLTRSYYEKITINKYFSNFDPNIYPIFATLWHISIVPKNGYIPYELLEEIPIPNTIEDVKNIEIGYNIKENNCLTDFDSKYLTDYVL